MYKYKLKKEYSNDGERSFIGYGVTKEGIIESDTKIESPLLELVSNGEQAPAPVQAVAPVATTPVASVPTPQPQQPNQEQA